jgi:hypothetical protein
MSTPTSPIVLTTPDGGRVEITDLGPYAPFVALYVRRLLCLNANGLRAERERLMSEALRAGAQPWVLDFLQATAAHLDIVEPADTPLPTTEMLEDNSVMWKRKWGSLLREEVS